MPDDRNYYLETIARLEPDIAAIDLTAAAASIAISLHRIADALDKEGSDKNKVSYTIYDMFKIIAEGAH